MTWQPIETAPVGRSVILGRWWLFMGKMEWDETTDVAFHSAFFGLFKTKSWAGERYTHWRDLPPPPEPPSEHNNPKNKE